MAGTSQAPDPKTFKTWEDAFAYPVPAVRRMEQQLRTDVSGNRERLRSLVGGSYRDLLGTADTIINMDGRMHGVEALVARVGRRCNSGMLERTKIQSRKLMSGANSNSSESTGRPITSRGKIKARLTAGSKNAEFALASQISVFRACPNVILRILRRDESLLLAAKVLVISRVLHKKLKQLGGQFQEIVDSTLDKLGRIRAKVLEAIELRLSKIPIDNEALVDAMSAYALANTASTADILRYFHQTRASSMTRCMLEAKEDRIQAVRSLQLWLQTLRDTTTIFPRLLAQTLNQLKAEPIIAGEDVQQVTALELDIHQGWLDEDVLNFIPYVRHDDLDITAAKKQVAIWAESAFQKYLKELEDYLAFTSDLIEAAEMRKECLTSWFEGNSRTVGISRHEVLKGLREAFSKKMSHLTRERCENLSQISDQLEETIENWTDEIAEPFGLPIWGKALVSTDLSHGAKRFTGNLQASLQGRSRALERSLRQYRSWAKIIEEIEASIDEQRRVKWQDIGDDLDEDLDDEDLRDQMLSKADPDALHKVLKTSLESALTKFNSKLAGMSKRLTASGNGNDRKAAYLLRFVREMITSLPATFKAAFNTSFTSQLYQPISITIAKSVAEKNRKHIEKSLQMQELAVRSLWSEDEELPILPSPWTLKIIKHCHKAMDQAGIDLWTDSGVAALKMVVIDRLEEIFKSARTAAETQEKEPAKDVSVQQLLDVLYLCEVLRPSAKNESSEALFEAHIEYLKKFAKLSAEARDQLANNAASYWARSSLLFALFK